MARARTLIAITYATKTAMILAREKITQEKGYYLCNIPFFCTFMHFYFMMCRHVDYVSLLLDHFTFALTIHNIFYISSLH